MAKARDATWMAIRVRTSKRQSARKGQRRQEEKNEQEAALWVQAFLIAWFELS